MLRLEMSSSSLMITKEAFMMAQRVMIRARAECVQLRQVNILIALFLNFLVIFLVLFLVREAEIPAVAREATGRTFAGAESR